MESDAETDYVGETITQRTLDEIEYSDTEVDEDGVAWNRVEEWIEDEHFDHEGNRREERLIELEQELEPEPTEEELAIAAAKKAHDAMAHMELNVHFMNEIQDGLYAGIIGRLNPLMGGVVTIHPEKATELLKTNKFWQKYLAHRISPLASFVNDDVKAAIVVAKILAESSTLNLGQDDEDDE